MSEVIPFVYQDLEVRTIVIENEPWFVAMDVCNVLEHSDTSMAVKRLDDDEKLTQAMFVSGQNREVWLVNESGLYSLILTSRKPEAKAFKRWITHDVIPALRKAGTYTLSNNLVPLDERKVRMELLKTAIDHEARLETVEQRIETVEKRVDEKITLDSGEQRKLQKAVALKVYTISQDSDERKELFRQLHREIKDRWAVPSYKDVRHTELEEVLRYVEAWKPRVA